jgi:hypothetical protein
MLFGGCHLLGHTTPTKWIRTERFKDRCQHHRAVRKIPHGSEFFSSLSIDHNPPVIGADRQAARSGVDGPRGPPRWHRPCSDPHMLAHVS